MSSPPTCRCADNHDMASVQILHIMYSIVLYGRLPTCRLAGHVMYPDIEHLLH